MACLGLTCLQPALGYYWIGRPLLDTTALHAGAAVDFARAENTPIVVDAY